MMKRVILESPYAGDVERNTLYARRALLHSLSLHEAPLASHLLYPQCLNDSSPLDRALGLKAGFAWTFFAEAVVVYTDYGISDGMMLGIRRAEGYALPITYRKIGENNG